MNQIEITFEGTLWTQPYNEHRYSPGRGVNVLERARTTLSVLRSEQCVRKGGYIPACTLPVTQPSRTRDRIRCNSSTAIPPHPDHRSTLQTPSISLAACIDWLLIKISSLHWLQSFIARNYLASFRWENFSSDVLTILFLRFYGSRRAVLSQPSRKSYPLAAIHYYYMEPNNVW